MNERCFFSVIVRFHCRDIVVVFSEMVTSECRHDMWRYHIMLCHVMSCYVISFGHSTAQRTRPVINITIVPFKTHDKYHDDPFQNS